jgi:hypothetical protein
MTYTDTDGSIRCTNPAASVNTPTQTCPKNTGAIVGGAVGGTIGGLILLFEIIWYFYRRRKRPVQTRSEISQLPSEIGDDHSRKVVSPTSATGITTSLSLQEAESTATRISPPYPEF